MPLTFHIIYVPGSVDYLLPFVDSLLRWSPYTFRLVSNGCSPAEQRLLQAYCRSDPRLEYLALPTVQPLYHSHALNYLQAICREDAFCFMDSDIFACGPFLENVDSLHLAYAGVFAGAPFWLLPEDQVMPAHVNVATGEHSRTYTGLPLGVSFLAVYDNRLLASFIRRTGLGFQICDWGDLPPWLQTWCAARGMVGYWFDTGKALNLGLQAHGHQLIVLDSPNLIHLGGISFIAKRRYYDMQKSRALWVGGLYYRARELYIRLRRRMQNDPVFRSARLPFLRRRRRYGSYFADLLEAEIRGRRPPALPAEDHPLIRQRAQFAAEEISRLLRRFASQRALWEEDAGLDGFGIPFRKPAT
ncbi:MAG: glycosyltransferase [Anaerolineae bacterium]|nr:glycosyltransferase [Anaerolineae bacterium]